MRTAPEGTNVRPRCLAEQERVPSASGLSHYEVSPEGACVRDGGGRLLAGRGGEGTREEGRISEKCVFSLH